MEDLIKALQIFLKYGNLYSPTHCEHDELYVAVDPEDVLDEDKIALDKLGFMPNEEHGMFFSYRFGSC